MMILPRCLAATAVLLALAACSPDVDPRVETARAIAADPAATHEQVALAMVQANDLGRNLEQLALRAATSTVTWPVLTKQLGGADPKPLVTRKIREQLPKHQATWDTNLAAAYASVLTTEQMRSIAELGKDSPHFSELQASARLVSPLMRTSSESILREVTFKAMSASLLAPAQ